MNRGDIKLVIDQLTDIEYDKYIAANAITTIETLGNQVAAQAAVIEKLRDALEFYATATYDMYPNTARKALAIPSESKQILAEWLDSVLGEANN